MIPPDDNGSRELDAIECAAAEWTSRLDRRLTAQEQDDYAQWLAADPRHRVAMAEHRWGWEELDRLAGLQEGVPAPPNSRLFARTLPAEMPRGARLLRSRQVWSLVTAAVVAGVFGIAAWNETVPPASEPRAVVSTALAAPCENRVLEDGSTVELNRGARLAVEFTRESRRVRLERGEANFIVAHDGRRPFVVEAGGVWVRALGTIFNVRVVTSEVEVVVTEGRVQLSDSGDTAAGTEFVPVLHAQEQAVVSARAESAVRVKTLSDAELQARLAWQPKLLEFTATPLPEIVAQFNRRNPVRLVIGSEALRALRLSASIRSDNVEGFVRLMQSDFGMQVEWTDETEIVLRKSTAR